MWLVSWLAAPHMLLDLAVENANAKNIIFRLLSDFASLQFAFNVLGEPVQCY